MHFDLISYYAFLDTVCNPIGHSVLPGFRFQSKKKKKKKSHYYVVMDSISREDPPWPKRQFSIAGVQRQVSASEEKGRRKKNVCVVLREGSRRRQVSVSGLAAGLGCMDKRGFYLY